MRKAYDMIRKRFYFIVFIIFISFNLLGQSNLKSQLEIYVKTGLENNLTLKQKEANWKQAGLRLSQAKGLFYPDISLNARYTLADGGRIIEFPVGDLLNPVYSTLNMLTSGNSFPTIENEEFPFLRSREHETKLRLVQPLLNTDIFYSKKIRENNLDIQFSDVRSYQRSLIFEIKQAYYNYMKALELLELLENTMIVLQENLRINHSLFENHKITKDVVLRSESEIRKLEQNIVEAKGSVEVSEAYFNFLLNRDLKEPIIPELFEIPDLPPDVEPFMQKAISSREEIIKLEELTDLAHNNLKLNRSSRVPELFAVVDYGFQGEEYRFTAEDDFVIASLVFKWDLFKGLQEKSKITEAIIVQEEAGYKLEETRNLIKLDILRNWYDLVAAHKKLQASKANSLAASEAFRIISKKYSQNQASLLEFIDARNNKTHAEQDVIINSYDLLIKHASLERAAALSEFVNG